mgnify:CR=1 FL=1
MICAPLREGGWTVGRSGGYTVGRSGGEGRRGGDGDFEVAAEEFDEDADALFGGEVGEDGAAEVLEGALEDFDFGAGVEGGVLELEGVFGGVGLLELVDDFLRHGDGTLPAGDEAQDAHGVADEAGVAFGIAADKKIRGEEELNALRFALGGFPRGFETGRVNGLARAFAQLVQDEEFAFGLGLCAEPHGEGEGGKVGKC